MSTLIETHNLKKYFNTRQGMLHAVDGINIQIPEGKTLGVVGESGCGKSTLGRVLVKLLPATDGEVYFNGENILTLNKRQSKKLSTEMQMIFQDPYSSLNPRMTVSELIAEPIKVTKYIKGKSAINERVFDLMNTVGLAPSLINTYPHELDGGRRQRIGIARALALDPKFIVCDEPVSALDVSIQAQILNLLMDIQEQSNMAYMFITHNLSVVKHISDEILVMYLGQCVEQASVDELFRNPMHPYTKALLNAIPIADINAKKLQSEVIQGEITSPINPKPGCRFAPRCKYATKKCMGKEINFIKINSSHKVACTLFEQ